MPHHSSHLEIRELIAKSEELAKREETAAESRRISREVARLLGAAQMRKRAENIARTAMISG